MFHLADAVIIFRVRCADNTERNHCSGFLVNSFKQIKVAQDGRIALQHKDREAKFAAHLQHAARHSNLSSAAGNRRKRSGRAVRSLARVVKARGRFLLFYDISKIVRIIIG